MPMDLVAVDTRKERIYSFLSVTWAIIADVDIESEKYRGLGGARFTVGALARILSKNLTISSMQLCSKWCIGQDALTQKLCTDRPPITVDVL